ncbi:hypothetical protein ACGFYP_34070 [Streptomyces sp. NPDC048370]|uniref:hypothetical protein n=1 Tax=Streptomyces sp. NPDC048370 TaxID=3365540 RepID=UPI00371CEF5B
MPPAPPAGVAAPANSRTSAAGYASASLVEQIADRLHEVLADVSGDVEARRPS